VILDQKATKAPISEIDLSLSTYDCYELGESTIEKIMELIKEVHHLDGWALF